MTDYIMLPRAWLANGVIHDPNLSRLLLYLLGKANEAGEVLIDTAELNLEFGWSRQQSRTLISKVKAISGATASSTARATTLIFDIQPNKPIYQPQEQPHHQPQKVIVSPHPIDDYSSFIDTFNNKVKGTPIPQIRGLSDTRKKAITSRAKEYGGIEVLEAILDKVVASDFLSGRKTDFCATFDWIFKKANFIKILEGNYDNKPASASRDTPATRKEQRDRSLSLANEIVSNSDDIFGLYYGTGTDPDAR